MHFFTRAHHFVDKHHAYINKELPIISELVLKILKVHGKNHQELFKIHKLFNTLRIELEASGKGYKYARTEDGVNIIRKV